MLLVHSRHALDRVECLIFGISAVIIINVCEVYRRSWGKGIKTPLSNYQLHTYTLQLSYDPRGFFEGK